MNFSCYSRNVSDSFDDGKQNRTSDVKDCGEAQMTSI